jgi:proteasome lid subunit RPN8/RPN11
MRASLQMLTIRKTDLQRIYEHCDREYPNEACGILAGKDGRVLKVYSLASEKTSPISYHVDSKEHFRVLQEMREAGMGLVGIYHSHPDVPAFPSSIDVELAYYPEAVYAIVTLLDRMVPVIKGYTIVSGNVTEVLLNIVTEAA